MHSALIETMDLALYPGPAQEKLFLQDLYAALQSDAEVLAFDHYESCASNYLNMLATLAIDGTLPREEGDRMAASYINFYMCNGGAVVPTFGDPHDKLALEQLQKLMPERKIVAVPAREILLGGGNVHCITQQQPAAK